MDALQDEVESLEAILMDDVSIKRNQSGLPELIETTIYPVVDDDTDQQYICVTLQVLPGANYPDCSPEFRLQKPRGLDDFRLNAMKAACVEKLRESLGYPVVFDLIELIREHLTGSNLPSGQCVICLYGFADGDEFTKTQCFHYLHSYCLARHLIALRRNHQEDYDKLEPWQQKTAAPFQAACPVCRERINDDDYDSLKCAMPPAALQQAPDFQLTDELKELQRRMTQLFLQQKSRGAIIDLEAETGATVISIESEEEIRTRLQRKQVAVEGDEAAEIGNGHAINAVASSSTTSTNFAPVVQQTQRLSNDPTNNNYQHHQQQSSSSSSSSSSHNRRHYRGGRRHQQHHHHRNRDSERERERHENHNSSHSHAAPAAASVSGDAAAAAAGGKQAKGHAGCGGHAR